MIYLSVYTSLLLTMLPRISSPMACYSQPFSLSADRAFTALSPGSNYTMFAARSQVFLNSWLSPLVMALFGILLNKAVAHAPMLLSVSPM